MSKIEFSEIQTSYCDYCPVDGVPVVVHYENERCLGAECMACAPDAFEAQARKDIDSWLAGGSARFLGW